MIGRAKLRSTGAPRPVALALLTALVMSVLGLLLVPSANAEDKEETDNYSLYKLSSNASAWFGNENSPGKEGENTEPVEERMGGDESGWHQVTQWPAAGGALLGYADPDFSLSLEWLVSELSGSSQTISYDSLVARDGDGSAMPLYSGMLDYAYFGAANADLGLDSMSSGVMGGMMNAVTGSIIWFLYGLAVFVSTTFYFVIQVLKFINPFLWFYEGVKAINPTFAEGMTQGQTTPGPLQGLANFISGWYGLINDIAWQAMVPLFVGILMISLVMFKKMDRGGAIKKLVVRVLFIGIGLPLIGSMYTQVLDNFDDSMMGQHSGPTRVVLSTYVDFESWMMNDRLMIPNQAKIGWDPYDGHAWPDSTMAVRNTALSINKQSHGSVYDDIHVSTGLYNDGSAAWSDNNVSVEDGSTDTFAFMETISILNRFISGDTVAASDFESAIKSTITQLPNSGQSSAEQRYKWFADKDTYGDTEDFGTEDDPKPTKNPMISPGGTPGQTGLQSTATGGSGEQTGRDFKSVGVQPGCGAKVMAADNNGAAFCNLSPLAAYNYLNTGFDSSAMTLYSSNKATSGFTRENHQAVSQVGTGPASLMYFFNAGTILACIVILGFWYAIGMLVGSIKRTFSVVAAVPFATLGAMAAISKVVIYSVALILEVIVTLFLYQFVSEFLITLPDIVAGPFNAAFADGEIFGSWWAGAVMVVLMTFLSTLLTIGVTFALLRVRTVVLKAMDEAVTRVVDKFLDTDTPPMQPPNAGPLGKGLASGVGRGLGKNLVGGAGTKADSAGTNVGGTNRPRQLGGGPSLLQLEGGRDRGPEDDDDDDDGPDGPGSPGGRGGPGGGRGIDGASGSSRDSDRPSSQSDKTTASKVESQGGLSNLGFTGHDGKRGQAISLTPEQAAQMKKGALTGTVLTGQSASAAGSNALSARGNKGTMGTPTNGTRFGAGAGSSSASSSSTTGTGAGVPAGVGSLPTRADQVAAVQQRAAKDPAFKEHMLAKAGSAQAYAKQFGGPVLDDVNPQAAKAVDAAGGTQAYLAQHTGQAAGATSTSPAAAPRPLSQVPVTSKSSYVTRQPGESHQQFMKARSSAEGWTQTPQGWVPPAAPSSTPRTGAPTAPVQPTRAGAVVPQAAPRQAVAPSTPQAGAPSAAPAPAPQVAPQAPARVAPAPSAPQAAPVGRKQAATPRTASAPAPQVAPRRVAGPSGQGVTAARSGRVASSGSAAQGSTPQAPAPRARRGTPRKDAAISVEQNKRRPWWTRDDKKKGDR